MSLAGLQWSLNVWGYAFDRFPAPLLTKNTLGAEASFGRGAEDWKQSDGIRKEGKNIHR